MRRWENKSLDEKHEIFFIRTLYTLFAALIKIRLLL